MDSDKIGLRVRLKADEPTASGGTVIDYDVDWDYYYVKFDNDPQTYVLETSEFTLEPGKDGTNG